MGRAPSAFVSKECARSFGLEGKGVKSGRYGCKEPCENERKASLLDDVRW